MKKRAKVVLSICMALTLLACSNTKEVVTEEMEISNFKLGDTTTIALNDIVLCSDDLNLFVQFDSLITDSRCPRGANCIWEGDAEVALSITYIKELQNITLHTAKKFETSKSAFGFKFELIEINPYPGTMNAEQTPTSVKISVSKED